MNSLKFHIVEKITNCNTQRLGGVVATLACSLASQTLPTQAWIGFSINTPSLCMILKVSHVGVSWVWFARLFRMMTLQFVHKAGSYALSAIHLTNFLATVSYKLHQT